MLMWIQSRSNHSGCGWITTTFAQPVDLSRWVKSAAISQTRLTRYADIDANLSQVLDLINIASTVKARVVKDAIFEGEELLFNRLHDREPVPLTETGEDILVQLSSNLFDLAHQDEIESLRLKRAKAVIALARISKGRLRLTGFLERGIPGARDAERSDGVRKLLDQAISSLSGSSS